jgi:hypothetical protein
MGDEVLRMKVWTLFVNGELNGIFDSEEKAVEARRQGLARGLEGEKFAVLSIRQWAVQ